jgi:hypothetical protein
MGELDRRLSQFAADVEREQRDGLERTRDGRAEGDAQPADPARHAYGESEQRGGGEHLRQRGPERRPLEREQRQQHEVRGDVLHGDDGVHGRQHALTVLRDEQGAGQEAHGEEHDRRREQRERRVGLGIVGAEERVDHGIREHRRSDGERERERQHELERALEDSRQRGRVASEA